MRVWLVIALLGCGHDRETTHEPRGSAATSAASVTTAPAGSGSASSDDDLGRRLADELVQLPDSRLLYLHDLGWIRIQRRATATTEWTSSPDLVAEANHQPAPKQPAAWRDERGRYMAAIHDGDQNPPGEDPDLDVVRLYWSEDFIDRLHHELIDKLLVTIPHVGHLAIDHDVKGAHIAFEASPELLQRLNAR